VLAKAGATLETVVVSRNPLSTSDALLPITATAASLRKLSASQCGLTSLPVLDLPLVNELRLAGNGFEEFAEGTRFRSLKILDVSSNKLASIASMTLFALFVDQLHIHGNPVAEATDEAERSGFARIIARVFKQLAILDGRAFDRAAALKSSRPDRPDDNASDDDVDADAMADVPVARRPPRAERDRDVESAPAMRKQHVVPAPTAAKTEVTDVVFEGPVPDVKAPQRTYIRTVKKHGQEAPPSPPPPTRESYPDRGSRRHDNKFSRMAPTPAPLAPVPVAVKGAAALRAMAANEDPLGSAGGW
jgi:hypothetical protein